MPSSKPNSAISRTNYLMKDELLMENALDQFQYLARQKFMAGIVEHNLDGTKGLDRMPLLEKVDACKEEVMDLWFYLYAIEQKLLNPRKEEQCG
jgi:hypothetical protein